MLSVLLLLGAPLGAAIHDVQRSTDLRGGEDITAKEAMIWLQRRKPDFDSSGMDLVAAHAVQAVESRKAFAWSRSVPLELFRGYVLPYTHFDEKPEKWRNLFFERLKPLLNDKMTLKEAATAIQQGVWSAFGEPKIRFKGNSTPEVLSPSDVFSKRYGSCTGLSIFLADALRSCGVPARIVGVAEWNQPSKGNHNWVEVWFEERWNFVDAGPGEHWNKVWFMDLAQKAVEHSLSGIYSPMTWLPERSNAVYLVTWANPQVKLPAIELTALYKDPLPLRSQAGHDITLKVIIVGVSMLLVGVLFVVSRLRGIGAPAQPSC